MQSISDVLRTATLARIKAGETYYSIAKASGVNQQILARFVNSERKEIRIGTADRLAAYFGLSLTPDKSAGKPPLKPDKPKPKKNR